MSENTQRILIVEDNESVLDLLSQVLTEEGYAVSTAASSKEALALFEKDSYPLIITDMRLDEMSGIRLLEIIKNLNEKTQVIIITSHASLETARSAISAGAYDYLVKPFDELDIITNVVKRAFDKIHLMDENQMLQDQLKDNV